MACQRNVPLEQLLGMGYSGYAQVGSYFFRLIGGQTDEDDNLIRVDSSYASDSYSANGQIPTLNRRVLKISLSFEFTPSLATFVRDAFISWRSVYNEGAPAFPVRLIVARGQGYYSDEAYVDSLSVSNPENALTTGQLQLTCFVWNYLDGDPALAKLASPAYDPFAIENRPIPHWSNCAEISSLDAVCKSWNLDLQNNWQYTYLLEGNRVVDQAPNPRLIYPGPLDSTLKISMLAKIARRPPEASPATIQMTLPRPEGRLNVMKLQYPMMVRYPNQAYSGFGSANTPITWETAYYSLGQVPLWSIA